MLVDARHDTRFECSDRAPSLGEQPGELDLELQHLIRQGCDPGEGVAGQKAQGELVRILKHNRIIDCHAQRGGGRTGRSHGTRDVGSLQDMAPSSSAQSGYPKDQAHAVTCASPGITQR